MNILSKAIINAENDKFVSGLVLIQDVKKKKTKYDDGYLDGVCMAQGSYSFKIWPGALYDSITMEDLVNQVAYVEGTVKEYQGKKGLIVSDLKVITDVDTTMFLESKYDVESLNGVFTSIVNSSVSPKGISLLDKLLLSNEELFARFVKEFAASKHHDNTVSGLFAHTVKMLQVLDLTKSVYKSMFSLLDFKNEQDAIDLVYLGVILHDVGKTKEMYNGVYQPNSAVSHRFFGVELLMSFKDTIVALYNEKWYYDLCSIILEHHGEFGDPCKTVVAQIVHFIDYYESQVTGVIQTMENDSVESFVGKSIWYNNHNLSM